MRIIFLRFQSRRIICSSKGLDTLLKDLVSILIPVYNREKLVAESIKSALNQTYTNIEVIIVDNASTDNTWQICKKLAQKDNRIHIFRNETNIGPVRNWRRCIYEARGEYIKILFSDDLIKKNYLIKTLPCLKDPKVGFVFTEVLIGSKPKRSKVFYNWRKKNSIVESYLYIRDALLGTNIPISPGSALFRTEDLSKNLRTNIPSVSILDFESHGAGPDLLTMLLTAKDYPKVAFIHEPLAFFRSHTGAISKNNKNLFLTKCYDQVRIWFALKYTDKQMAQRVIAQKWLFQSIRSRRWINPSSFSKLLAYSYPWSWQAVSWASLRLIHDLKELYTGLIRIMI